MPAVARASCPWGWVKPSDMGKMPMPLASPSIGRCAPARSGRVPFGNARRFCLARSPEATPVAAVCDRRKNAVRPLRPVDAHRAPLQSLGSVRSHGNRPATIDESIAHLQRVATSVSEWIILHSLTLVATGRRRNARTNGGVRRPRPTSAKGARPLRADPRRARRASSARPW